MGFWDQLKKVKNYVTGGGASLKIQLLETPSLSKAFKIKLDIDVDEVEIEADKIYLELKYTEQVEIEVDSATEQGSRNRHKRRKTSVLFEEAIILDEMLVLNANEQYEYEVEITLPLDAKPAIEGIHAKFSWSLKAFVAKSGNNPNSETLYFEPEYR